MQMERLQDYSKEKYHGINVIDGKVISKQIKDELKEEVAQLKAKGIEGSLAVIQVGNDPASSVYVR